MYAGSLDIVDGAVSLSTSVVSLRIFFVAMLRSHLAGLAVRLCLFVGRSQLAAGASVFSFLLIFQSEFGIDLHSNATWVL